MAPTSQIASHARLRPHRLQAASLLAWLTLAFAACGQPQPDTNSDPPSDRELQLLLQGKPGASAPEFADATEQRDRVQMVEQQIERRGIESEAVLEAMRSIPRHLMVPDSLQARAYDDRPLPIGHGQTISQPYIVALMTELLQLEPDDQALEIGTGSGYQASVLGHIVDYVVTIEIVEALAERAADTLEELGYQNITVLHGDGYFGYEDAAPYDAIVVTAAAEHIPPPLIAQLKNGGRMVIPVGRAGWTQNLMLVEKDEQGDVTTRNLLPVRFVPLTRETR